MLNKFFKEPLNPLIMLLHRYLLVLELTSSNNFISIFSDPLLKFPEIIEFVF